METSKTRNGKGEHHFSQTVHQAVDRAADGAGAWMKSLTTAIKNHPVAGAMIGVATGYLILTARSRDGKLARMLARRVLMASAGLIARAAYEQHNTALH
jgi:hypothetical protein